MYINSISVSNNLTANNPQFKSKRKFVQSMSKVIPDSVKMPAKTLQALFLGGTLMLGATGCDEKLHTPITKEINEEELAKYAGLTPAEVKASADALNRLIEYTLYNGICYHFERGPYGTPQDSSLMIVLTCPYNTQDTIFFKYDKNYKNFSANAYPVIKIQRGQDGNFSIINISHDKLMLNIFSQLDYTKDGQIVKKHNSPDKKEVKMTDGLVKNRSEEEIREATGLTKIEYVKCAEAAYDILQNYEYDDFETEYMGSEYDKNIFGKKSLYIKFRGSSFRIEKCKDGLTEIYFSIIDGSWIKCLRDENNGDFTILIDYPMRERVVRKYTKDGISKDINNKEEIAASEITASA